MHKKIFILILPLLVLASPALAQNGGRLTQSVSVEKKISVGLNNPNWYIAGINQPEILVAQLNGDQLLIEGRKAGLATVYACPSNTKNLTDCLYVTVSVAPENVLGEAFPKSPNQPHTIGAFILNGKTVFYVAAEGLIPIPTWKIFTSVSHHAQLQEANDFDLQLPLLPLMEYGDQRVK